MVCLKEVPLSPHMQHKAADKHPCCVGEVPQKLRLCDNILFLPYVCPAPLIEFIVLSFLMLHSSTFKFQNSFSSPVVLQVVCHHLLQAGNETFYLMEGNTQMICAPGWVWV